MQRVTNERLREMAKSKNRQNGASKRNRQHAHAMSAEAVRQRQEHYRGNAAGKHLDRRSKRQRTRGAIKQKAIASDWWGRFLRFSLLPPHQLQEIVLGNNR